MKLEEEDKALLLLSSLSQNYNHLATTIIYEKKNLRVESCQANAPEERADEEDRFHSGGLGLVVNEQRERSQSKGLKKGTKASNENFDYYKQPGHMKKTCSKYKEMLKKKDGPGANEASTSGKQTNQASVADEAVEKTCDVLSLNLSLIHI